MSQQLRWQVWHDKPSDLTHVIPTTGRKHDINAECWCEPRRDQEESRVVIHNHREVA